MKRTVIKIDEELCNGCGLCIDGCHEGALQLVDGKARMISDLYCDGLGACIGECPVGAITFEEREAEPYDEIRVMERISPNGEATVLAHLNHLIDHDQMEYVQQGVDYIRQNNLAVDLSKLKNFKKQLEMEPLSTSHQQGHSGCPGSRAISFERPGGSPDANAITDQPSELRQWPVQLHLVNPHAPYFQNADILLAADCVAFSMGNFHNKYLKGRGLAIACPKLDSGKEMYIEKLAAMIDQSKINTLTVMIMEVPCCHGLLQLAKMASQKASRKVPVKSIIVSLQGEINSEDWQ
ncbi:MAG TPA: 4Fe-4S binding protein [Bacteroidales bacterium]|nr:4Fe-4S binding protein [Bacteroidales bacterium]